MNGENFSASEQQAIKKYRKISKQLAQPKSINGLKKLFKKAFSLQELLDWTHEKLRWAKGEIARHTDPMTILEYGKGRCGEYSILYTAACIANGHRARIVLDMTDHVWTEIWNETQRRWMHIDPSEKRIDDPKMYERDWKKTLTKVIAFENGKAEDVTRTYKLD